MSLSRVLVPFAVGVAVGVLVHKYRDEILKFGGPNLERGARGAKGLLRRARAKFSEQGEKFADLVAEIREEEEAARSAPRPAPVP